MLSIPNAADLLWNLGLAKAWSRPPHWAKLDALTEATIWICDLFAPTDGHDYHLSHVQVRRHDKLLKTSLPDFAGLPAPPPPRILPLHQSLALRLPPQVANENILDQIQERWNAALAELRIDFDFLSDTADDCHTNSGVPSIADRDHIHRFQRSLRVAFDSVVTNATDDLFTLWLRPTHTRHFVTTDYSVHYGLGYCLPRHSRHTVISTTRMSKSELDDPQKGLEVVLVTEAPQPFRTQSHIFTETRLSGFVRNFDKYVKQTGGPSIIPNQFTHIEDLEKKMWGKSTSKATDIFMMPLVNYGFHADDLPRVTALLYKKTLGGRQQIVDAAVKRQSINVRFHRSMYVSCCDAIAERLSTGFERLSSGFDRRATELDQLNLSLDTLIKTYGERFEVRVEAQLAESEGKITVLQQLQTAHASNLGKPTYESWRDLREGLLEYISGDLDQLEISYNKGAPQTDILAALLDNLLALMNKKRQRSRFRANLGTMEEHIDGLRNLISRTKETTGLDDHVAHLNKMQILFEGGGAQPCTGDIDAIQIPGAPEGLWYLQAHDIHDNFECGASDDFRSCEAEVLRRLYYVSRARMLSKQEKGNERAPSRVTESHIESIRQARALLSFLHNDKPGLWEWMKRASEKASPETPGVVTVVTCIFMQRSMEAHNHCTVEVCRSLLELCRERIRGLRADWQDSLQGIVELAIPEKPEKNEPAAELSMAWKSSSGDHGSLRFVLKGDHIPPMFDAARKNAKSKDDGGSSRLQQFRRVYMNDDLPQNLTGTRNGVEVEYSDRSGAPELTIDWTDLSIDGASELQA